MVSFKNPIANIKKTTTVKHTPIKLMSPLLTHSYNQTNQATMVLLIHEENQ